MMNLREENNQLLEKLAEQDGELSKLEELQSKFDELKDEAESREKTIVRYSEKLAYYTNNFLP